MKNFKKVISFLLALVMMIGIASAVVSQEKVSAATTKNYTFVKGEQWEYTIYGGKVSSCSSNKKSVVSVSKKDNNTVKLNAKAKGSATITVKLKGGSKLYLKLKVVDAKFSFKPVGKYSSYVVYKVTNNSDVTYARATFKFNLKDASGRTVKSDYDSARCLLPGKSCYVSVYGGYNISDSVKLSKCTAKIDASQSLRYINTKYTSASKYVSYTSKKTAKGEISVKFTSKLNAATNAYADVVFFDANDNIVYSTTCSSYLQKKGTDTRKAYYTTSLNFDHYKVYFRSHTEKYIK